MSEIAKERTSVMGAKPDVRPEKIADDLTPTGLMLTRRGRSFIFRGKVRDLSTMRKWLMGSEELQVGKIYVVSTYGPLKLSQLAPSPDSTHTFTTHNGTNVWAFADEVCGECPPELLAKYAKDGEVRGVACKNDDCWCKPILRSLEE